MLPSLAAGYKQHGHLDSGGECTNATPSAVLGPILGDCPNVMRPLLLPRLLAHESDTRKPNEAASWSPGGFCNESRILVVNKPIKKS